MIELKYVDRKQVILFWCDWYDTNPKNNWIHEDHYFISIDTRYFWYKNEPFILASQAQQVFYVDNIRLGNGWKIVQRIQHRHLWDVPEIEEVDEPEVDEYQCVDPVGDFEPQTLHRDDVDSTVVCDDGDLIEIVLDFDERVEDKLEDDENEGDEEDEEVEEDDGDEVEDDDVDEDEEDYW